jgi:glycine cleavage system aminomethyltransferase T
MNTILRTPLNTWHVDHGAQMVPFGGWDMPIQYAQGIVQEHLATRKEAGLFDVSHMGRFIIRGDDALAFLQHVLTNNAAALELEESQYTLIPNETGGAIDDAYLYRFEAGEYLLVVNAANRDKDWQHLQARLRQFNNVEIVDQTDAVAMLSLQGPLAKQMVLNLIDTGPQSLEHDPFEGDRRPLGPDGVYRRTDLLRVVCCTQRRRYHVGGAGGTGGASRGPGGQRHPSAGSGPASLRARIGGRPRRE